MELREPAFNISSEKISFSSEIRSIIRTQLSRLDLLSRFDHAENFSVLLLTRASRYVQIRKSGTSTHLEIFDATSDFLQLEEAFEFIETCDETWLPKTHIRGSESIASAIVTDKRRAKISPLVLIELIDECDRLSKRLRSADWNFVKVARHEIKGLA